MKMMVVNVPTIQFLLRDKDEKVVITRNRKEMERLLERKDATLIFDAQDKRFKGFFPDKNTDCFVVVIQCQDGLVCPENCPRRVDK